MKEKTGVFKLLLTLSLCIIFATACNNGNEADENRDGESSFFSDQSEDEPSEELNISSEEIASALNSGSGRANLLNRAEVEDFYNTRDNAAVWIRSGRRNSFYTELSKAGEEGLFFENYHGNELKELMQDPAALPKEDQASLELLLTDAFFEYAGDLFYGKLDPDDLHEIWGVERNSKDLTGLLQEGIENNNISEVLADLKPQHQVYADLKNSLQEYRELKKSESHTRINEEGLIEAGEKDERIPAVVQRLKELDLLDPNYTSEENIYDKELQEAVKRFQDRKRLQIDGILGNSTIRELNMGPEERYNQILANLERWRWYPRDLGEHYVLINIPAYKLAVVKEGDTVRTHDVVAGTKERPTPIFSDTLQYIVINPEWTIPHTIKHEDVIPSAANNPNYLRNNNISVFSPGGKRIDPSSIDWSGDEVYNYTYVQKSGPSNPLGRVKLIYPNDYAIYLHDTPAKSLFEQNERAESSGCVRVQDAIDLAAYVVREQDDWDLERIRNVISGGETTHVKIESPIQVHHFYWTAWRDNGETVFTEDVYEKDRSIYTALKEN